jgi:hypothetical protein
MTMWRASSRWLGEAALERHQARPVDAQAATGEPFAVEAPCGIDHLGAAPQHLLGIAAAQLTGAPVR